jgi:hypothetical protein
MQNIREYRQMNDEEEVLMHKLDKLKERLIKSVYMTQRDKFLSEKSNNITNNIAKKEEQQIINEITKCDKSKNRDKISLDIIPMILIVLVIVIFIMTK